MTAAIIAAVWVGFAIMMIAAGARWNGMKRK